MASKHPRSTGGLGDLMKTGFSKIKLKNVKKPVAKSLAQIMGPPQRKVPVLSLEQLKNAACILVIDGDSSHNWFSLLHGHRFVDRSGQERWTNVEMSGFENIQVVSSSHEGCVLQLLAADDPLHPKQKRSRKVKPDFVLVRNFANNLHGTDYKHVLIALNFAGIPAVNSLTSAITCCERALMYAELIRLRKRLGNDAFPFIDSTFYPNRSQGGSGPSLKAPCVVKVGSSCAGFGKMKCDSQSQLSDLRGCLALSKEYFTTEPFVESLYDMRIQQIGDHVRMYKRSNEGSWKRNSGGSFKYDDVEMTPRYSKMAEEVAKLFGGLDIFSIDLLRLKDGTDVILEVNDTYTGLFTHAAVDRQHIASLVVARMAEELGTV